MGRIISGGMKGSQSINRPAREPIPTPNLPGEYIAPSEEGLGGLAVRTGARTLARGLETAAGIPGSIAEAGFDAANYLTRGAVPTYSEIQEKLPVSLPTPENIREKHEQYTGEYLKPQGAIEEAGDTLTSLISSLISPVSGVVGLASKAKLGNAVKQIPRAAKIAATALGGSELVKQLGGSELAGEATKLGVLLASGLPGGAKALKEQANKAYDITKKVKDDVFIKAPNLKSTVKKLADQVELGHLTEDKEAVQKLLKSFDKAFDKGNISTTGGFKQRGIQVKEAAQLEKDINNLLSSYKLPKKAEPPFLQLKNELTSALTKYGARNKEFGKAYGESKEIWRALHARSGISKFLEKNFDLEDLFENKITKSALFGSAIYNLPKTVTGLAAGALASESVKAVELFARSPQAKKYYWDSIKAALNNNKNAFINSARKLDKLVGEESPESLPQFNPIPRRGRIISGGFKG